MLALKMLLTVTGMLLLTTAFGLPLYALWLRIQNARRAAKGEESVLQPEEISLRGPVGLALVACLPLLLAGSIVVVPSGMGGVRISQIEGTLPETLYPGVHFITPLVDNVQIFDLRDHIFTAGMGTEGGKGAVPKTALDVQSREGLNIGLGVTVRYKLDSNKLASAQVHLPQPADKEIVPPVVASAWRELAPQYTVREIFSTKREEVRAKAASVITRKLGADGIVVEEVMLSDVQLPEEYAKGLEGLLLKEQQDDQMSVDTDIQQKQVRIAELQAEAEAAQKVKQAEGDAKSKVVEAKGEADAMQYTLPLKEKQIQQTRLEAAARKEATVQQAQAQAEAKVIDGKAELERRKLMNEADLDRVQLLSKADAEKMHLEGVALKDYPMLIQKIIAEKLSDKVQIMMVPSDGKFFFANDVLKGAMPATVAADPQEPIRGQSGSH